MTPDRVRVVLAERRGARKMRARIEFEEQTAVGDVLIRGLVRAQLGLALRLAFVVVVVLTSVPLLAMVFPWWGSEVVFGVRLAWLVPGAIALPLLYGVGALYVRGARRIERDFTRLVED